MGVVNFHVVNNTGKFTILTFILKVNVVIFKELRFWGLYFATIT